MLILVAAVLVLVGVAIPVVNSAVGGRAGSTAVAADIFAPDGSVISKDPVVVAGVQVDEPSVNLGRQPLSTAVEKTFTLRNTGGTPVTLGRAGIEVLEGCCPTDPVLNTNRIEPGQEVPLLFSLPMGMHKGMDGPHLFRLTVPVQNDNGEAGNVEIYVKADFG
ncbi:MAG: hypothetical protein IH609_00665 [Dehalococcoidia bacterium]|nr:hypothetical protein [Dehalococcoidia bacterium]